MRKLILLIISGFIISNTQYSIGIDLKREINASPHDASNITDIRPYIDGTNLPGLTIGIEKLGHLGKRKRMDLGFEYSISTTGDTRSFRYNNQNTVYLENITMSLINFYTKWNFIDTHKLDFFIKIGHTEIINYNINGTSISNRSSLFSGGLGVVYKSKFRISYDSMGFSVHNLDDLEGTNGSIDFYHSGTVSKINLAYLF
ncbi:MAG: hypothetical protein CMF45_03580 [Legionellales bacterium]|nr:hypothetical protein [Legionellales bacterium]